MLRKLNQKEKRLLIATNLPILGNQLNIRETLLEEFEK
jgi:hypothetical protein